MLDGALGIEFGRLVRAADQMHAHALGLQRALQLAADHRDQREVLAFLRARMHKLRPSVLVVRELRSFIATVREDMAREEVWLQDLDGGG